MMDDRTAKGPSPEDRAQLLGPQYGVVQAITTACAMLDVDELRTIRRNLERLDTVGPILDPTGYRNLIHKHAYRVEAHKDVLDKLVALASAVQHHLSVEKEKEDPDHD